MYPNGNWQRAITLVLNGSSGCLQALIQLMQHRNTLSFNVSFNHLLQYITKLHPFKDSRDGRINE